MNPIQWLKETLESEGLQLNEQTAIFGGKTYCVNCLPVHVSVARAKPERKYPRWQFNIPDFDAPVKGAILIAVDGNGNVFAYVLPPDEIDQPKRYEITSHPTKYKGYLAQYLNAWKVIKRQLPRKRRKARVSK